MKEQKQTNHQCLQESLSFLVNCRSVIPNMSTRTPGGTNQEIHGYAKKTE